MNIDEKIAKRLSDDAAEIDRILAAENKGLVGMLNAGLKGPMRPWFILVNLLVLINCIALVFSGYQFFTQAGEQQLFWGVLLIVSF